MPIIYVWPFDDADRLDFEEAVGSEGFSQKITGALQRSRLSNLDAGANDDVSSTLEDATTEHRPDHVVVGKLSAGERDLVDRTGGTYLEANPPVDGTDAWRVSLVCGAKGAGPARPGGALAVARLAWVSRFPSRYGHSIRRAGLALLFIALTWGTTLILEYAVELWRGGDSGSSEVVSALSAKETEEAVRQGLDRCSRVVFMQLLQGDAACMTREISQALRSAAKGSTGFWGDPVVWLLVAGAGGVVATFALLALVFERARKGWVTTAMDVRDADRKRFVLITGLSTVNSRRDELHPLERLRRLVAAAVSDGDDVDRSCERRRKLLRRADDPDRLLDRLRNLPASMTVESSVLDCLRQVLTTDLKTAKGLLGDQRFESFKPILVDNSYVQNLRAIEAQLAQQGARPAQVSPDETSDSRRLVLLVVPSEQMVSQKRNLLEEFELLVWGLFGDEVLVRFCSEKRGVDYERYEDVKGAIQRCLEEVEYPFGKMLRIGEFLCGVVPSMAKAVKRAVPRAQPGGRDARDIGESWRWKDASRYVSLDITPGQKTFSVAAAVVTMNTDATITYVTSRGTDDRGGEFKTFDGRVEIMGGENL